MKGSIRECGLCQGVEREGGGGEGKTLYLI